jgi:undecaprenyl-diphosphatase
MASPAPPTAPPPTGPDPTATPTPAPASGLRAWDRRASEWFGLRWPHPRWLTRPLGWLSLTGNYGVIWFVLGAIGGLAAADAELGLRRFAYVGGAVLLCQGLTFFVKLGVRRRRPLTVDTEGEHHIPLPRSPSFPSSHASMSLAGTLTMSVLYPAWWGAFAALAALLAFSRVYLRVHYLMDVLAGLALGGAFGAAFVLLVPTP